MKKIALLLAIFTMVLSLTTVYADCGIKIDGVDCAFDDSTGYPYIKSDRMFVSSDYIFSKLGYMPVYDDSTKTIIAVKENSYIAMQIDSNDYHINDDVVTFDVAPSKNESAIFIPVRVIFEGIGYNVDFDNETKTAIITSK